VNLIEFVVILLILACGAGGSIYGGAAFGAFGYLAGFVVGAAALPVVAIVYVRFDEILYRGRPLLPPCDCGSEGETWTIERSGRHWAYHCACGRRYVKRGRRVFRLTPSGKLEPYRLWRPFGPWLPDSQRQTQSPYRQ
jgi:hypothetical protein